MKTTIKNQKTSVLEGLIYICSVAAFFLLVTSPSRNSLMVNIPLVLLSLLAGMVYRRKYTGTEALSRKKRWLFLSIYGGLTCWTFYRLWCASSKMTQLGEILHIPHRVLVLVTAVGLMTVSVPFALRTLSLLLAFTKGEQMLCDPIRNDGCNCKKVLLACFVVAAGTITVCSESSFLYPVNDWVDANCFFTVGKSMMNGIVPYRDLFEQKGPFLYFLHGLAWLLDHDSFLGVYILEVISATFFFYYTYQSARLFVSEKTAFLVLPLSAVIIYTSTSFCQGDSVEELCMPLLAYAIWVGFKAMVRNEDISGREFLIIGITSGLVFWSKFTIVGFYIGWFVVPALLFLKKKEYSKLLRAVGMVAAGVLLSTIPFLIYFGMNGAIGDWLKVYLYDNLFLYNKLGEESSGFMENMKMGRHWLFAYNRLMYLLCVLGMLWFFLKGKDRPWKNMLSMTFLTYLFGWAGSQFHLFGLFYLHRKKFSTTALYMTAMLFFTFLFTYMGGQGFAYYAFIFSVFVPYGVMAGLDLLGAVVPGLCKMLMHKFIPAFCVVLSIAAALWLTPNRYMMGIDKAETPQYQFAQIIGQKESPTLLNYGFLDGGFYTAANILPNCKAFCRLNIPLEEMLELQEQYVREGLCDFVVTHGKKLEYEHYICVAESNAISERIMKPYYLYQLK